MTKLEAVRAKIIEAIPNYADRFCRGDEDVFHFCCNCQNKIRPELSLADVLVALDELANGYTSFQVWSDGSISYEKIYGDGIASGTGPTWNLLETLDEQGGYLINFLYDILCK